MLLNRNKQGLMGQDNAIYTFLSYYKLLKNVLN